MPDKRVTFREIEAQSRTLGKEMLAAGLGKGSRIGIFYTYGPEFVIAWFAAARIGALVMPFSTIYKPAELTTVMRVGDVHTLLAPATLLGKDMHAFMEEAIPGLADQQEAPYFLPELPYLRQVWITDPTDRAWARSLPLDRLDPDAVSDAVFDAVEAEVTPADLAQVTYTSGSSALPKGVVHSHGAIVRTTSPAAMSDAGRAAMATLSENETENKFLCGFPFFWIGGTLLLGVSVQSGRTLCCLERFDPEPILDFIETERIGSFIAWPSLTQSLRSHPTFPGRDLDCCPSLTVNPSEAALSMSQVEGIPNHRGMSETVGNWNGVDRRTVDPETGTVIDEGGEGELVIRGYGVLQGYLKKEREETFDADGWLHTGDRVLIKDNVVYFVGRYTEMIKSKGANVSPREVEMALETFDEVAHALVYGMPHPEFEEEVVAAIVPSGTGFDLDAVLAKLRQRVSSYKVPTKVHILDDEEKVPWLASGKPDKLKLKAILEAGD